MSSSASSHGPTLALRATRWNGSSEEVVVQRMTIGGGEGDTVIVSDLKEGAVVIVPDERGDHMLQTRKPVDSGRSRRSGEEPSEAAARGALSPE